MARKSRKNTAQTPAVKTGMKVWKAALYIRLSVEFNGQRGDSLETQKKIMESFAALHPDIQVSGIYTDNGITGRTFERAAFQQMLADVEAGKINCIIVKDLSRLGRSTIDTGYYIEKYFPVRQVRFIAVNDQYDSEADQNSGEHIILPFKNMVNEAYAADISRKVRSQTRQSMKSGDYVGARPPYGYRKDPENCHKLIVNEETAPAVRDIFQWAADGVSLNRIATRLNEQGIITPGFYLVKCGLIKPSRLMGSGNWQTWTITKILADEVYVGDMVQGKRENKRRLQQQLGFPEDEGTMLLGMVTRMTSQKGMELAAAVMDELLKNARIQIAVLGTGQTEYENMFRHYAWKYDEKLSANICYSEELAHRIYASCDAFLMPSLFEPCGLSQLISMRYGTVPIVRETGGLKDTVEAYNRYDQTGTGFSFCNFNAREMLSALYYAMDIYYNHRDDWNAAAKRGMEQDFSWNRSAKEYEKIYELL